jgi:hypothetical protein
MTQRDIGRGSNHSALAGSADRELTSDILKKYGVTVQF